MTSADNPRHGTRNGYSNLGCRCDRCTEAHTAWVLDARRKRMEREPRAHGDAAYTNHRCRCAECRLGHAARMRVWRAG